MGPAWTFLGKDLIMKPVNAYDGEYEAFEILGQDALFSNFRIDRSTVPDGLYAYDLRDANDGIANEVKDTVTVNHFGTVITRNPIHGAEEGIVLGEDDTNFLGYEMTLDDFRTNALECEDEELEPS